MPAAKYYTWRGRTMTLTEWSEELGLSAGALSKRWNRYGDFDAAQKVREYTYQGETLTIREWAERYGLTYGTLKERLRRWGDLETALNMPSSDGALIELDGETLTLGEWAARAGTTARGIKSLAGRRRVDIAEAVRICLERKHGGVGGPPVYTARGQTMTLKEWSEALGEYTSTLGHRVRLYGPEIALLPRKEFLLARRMMKLDEAEKAKAREELERRKALREEGADMVEALETARQALEGFAFPVAAAGLKCVLHEVKTRQAVFEAKGGCELIFRITLGIRGGEIRAISRKTGAVICRRALKPDGKIIQPKVVFEMDRKGKIENEIAKVTQLIAEEEKIDPEGRLMNGLKNRLDVLRWELEKLERGADRRAGMPDTEEKAVPGVPV